MLYQSLLQEYSSILIIVLAVLVPLIPLVILAFRHQRLLIRCAIAEEKLSTQGGLKETFQMLSWEVLEKNNRSFLDLAKGQLGEKQTAIEEMITKLEGNMRSIESIRKTEHGAVCQQLKSLMESEQQLRLETSQLVKALKSPTARGRWGEIQLKRVVELAGMLSHCDFYEQPREKLEESHLRPDLVVRLPGERQIVIDAKVPLEAYLQAIESSDDAVKSLKLKDHSKHLRSHITALSKKSYWAHFTPTPEFVILFLPSEMIFSTALEQDPSLLEAGVAEGVIIATPLTLIALLRAVSYGWKQESISKHAETVKNLGQELYKRLVDMSDHWARVGRSLGGAVDAYNKATGSLETRVLSTARKFKDLGASASQSEIADIEMIDRLPRDVDGFEKLALEETKEL